MSTTIDFLTLPDILNIHADQLANYGGQEGVRDPGLLISALSQPSMTFGDEFLHKEIHSMAAAYLFHLVQNHPFVDGNKRVGSVSAIVFLEMNDFELQCDEDELEDLVFGVASGKLQKDDVTKFFKMKTVSLLPEA